MDQSLTNPEQQKAGSSQAIGFEYVAYDLYSGVQDYMQTGIRSIAQKLGRPAIASPLITIVYELATNGLKAIYKQAFYQYAIHEVGLGDIPYETWLNIFRSEINTNKAQNFAHVCRTHNLALYISAKMDGGMLRFEVINDGAASEIERDRIKKLYNRAKNEENFENLLLEEVDDRYREETGMGIPLVVLTLKGLGIPLRNFRYVVTKTRTIARVDIPLDIFYGRQDEKILVVENENSVKNIFWSIYKKLGYSVIQFTGNGLVKEISGPILETLHIPVDKSYSFPSLIKAKFFEDLFVGPFSIRSVEKFENYRISIPVMDGDTEWLFNVSGILNENGDIDTLWQPVNVNISTEKLSEGSLFESLHVQKLIAPYIPQMILDKAHESIRRGLGQLPNESKDVTILFADLIGFTRRSEKLPHNEVIDLLNLVMGVVVRSIEKNSGYIDKFIGDGVMCIFMEPLSAIVAAVEIQNNLFQLNEYRKAGGADPINMRIGINSGGVILGSVGTRKRMDWTALGDVVNTASRLEKLSRKNSVLVSSDTFERVKDHVVVAEKITEKIRGKDAPAELFFVKSVTFLAGDKETLLELAVEEQE